MPCRLQNSANAEIEDIEAVAGQLMGLLPPAADDIGHETLHWQKTDAP